MSRFFNSAFILIFFYSGAVLSQPNNEPIKDTCIKLPKALSVNSNTALTVSWNCEFMDFKFMLLDRWGKTIYETDKFSNPLDFNMFEKGKGTKKVELKYNSGVYFWRANYVVKTPDGLSKRFSVGSLSMTNTE